MLQQTRLRDSRGRFAKTKPSYKELVEKVSEQEERINMLTLVNDSICEFLEDHLPFWQKKNLSRFKEDLSKLIEK